MNRPDKKAWRIIALILTVAGIFFNYLMVQDNVLSRITDQYQSLFVPAGYAFMIWSVIYLSVIIYLVYSLTSRQLKVNLHEGHGKLLALLAVGGMAWIASYTNFKLGLSCVFILSMLAIALLSLKAAYTAIDRHNQPRTMIIPFSLYAAWLSVATISNISIWLKSTGWSGGFLGESGWAITLLLVAAGLGVLVTIRFKSVFYAMVIAWAIIGIWIKLDKEFTSVKYAALILGLIELVWVMIYITERRIARHKTFI